jgi:hypothetical protein
MRRVREMELIGDVSLLETSKRHADADLGQMPSAR